MMVSDASNEKAKQELASLLKENRAVLMVGAGSSKPVGYPLWGELVEELRQRFTPTRVKPADMSLAAFVDLVKKELKEQNKLEDYFNFLERRFEPRSSAKNHDDFHCALVRLPVCGVVTTNYDMVLETAIMEAHKVDTGAFLCEPLDLCQDRTYRVFYFLRNLSSRSQPSWVLHLHGYCRYPKQIVLADTDYSERYGERVDYDANGRPTRRVLDTLHRRVMWSLLCMHSLVLVGFSMQDEYFKYILKIVQSDFEIGSDPVHFAILPYTTAEEKDSANAYLERYGIRPVFFHVPQNPSESDYTGLGRLIFELADMAGVPISSSDISSISKRMLRR